MITRKSIILIFIILLWFIVSKLNIFSGYVLPLPQKVLKVFYVEMMNGNLIKSIYISLSSIFIGFSKAFVFAFIFGTITGIKKERLCYFENIISFIKNIPPMSLIAVLILCLGIVEKSKIIILASFIPMFINIREGIISVDKELIESAHSLNFSKLKIFFKIIIPNSLTSILTGMKIGLGYAFKVIIFTEIISASRVLRYNILDSNQLSRSDKAMASIITIVLLAYMFDLIFSYLIKKLSYSKNSKKDDKEVYIKN